MSVSGCASGGLVRGDVVEEDVGADNWKRKDLVSTVQVSLTELGYQTGNTRGIEDKETLDAVKQYRIDHQLQVNTEIDGALERHIDDFIWKTRNEKSVNPKDLAKGIVRNRHNDECARLFGEDYKNEPFPSNDTNNAVIYIYRLHNSSGKIPDYPDSKIIINDREVGNLSHNEYITVELLPGKYNLLEQESEPLKNKNSSDFTFTGEAGDSYFMQLSVGKVTTPNQVQTNAPFYIGGGILDMLLGELVWDVMNQHKYGKTFYFSNFSMTEDHIGECHIRMLSE